MFLCLNLSSSSSFIYLLLYINLFTISLFLVRRLLWRKQCPNFYALPGERSTASLRFRLSKLSENACICIISGANILETSHLIAPNQLVLHCRSKFFVSRCSAKGWYVVRLILKDKWYFPYLFKRWFLILCFTSRDENGADVGCTKQLPKLPMIWAAQRQIKATIPNLNARLFGK